MRHLDEGTIHAWLDGALSADQVARAEAHLASCTSCAEAVAEARGLIAASSRILTALDDVPNVKGARGAEGAKWGTGGSRFFLTTWLVRERIAAVVALIVAGGALAMVLSRDTPQRTVVQTLSESAQPLEVTVASAPPPPAAAVQDGRQDGQTTRAAGRRGAAAPQAGPRDLAAARQADSVPLAVLENAAQAVATGVPATPLLKTDDTLRAVAVAQARREAAQGRAEALSSLQERLRVVPGRGAAAGASAQFAEPRAAEPSAKGVVGAAFSTADTRLVQEERMMEAGREVRRRIYRVDDILVTLDVRLPDVVKEERLAQVERRAQVDVYAAPAAPPARQDTARSSTNTIQWTDARGAELTLTGSASKERLERIRKLLGY